jgi:gamma-glutamyl hercynylcysteine S-oxide synthase
VTQTIGAGGYLRHIRREAQPWDCMPTVTSIASTRRITAELLAEARARTVFLVSPLAAEDMTCQPPEGSGSVLSELTRILQFEAGWLLDSTAVAAPGCYDEWFDLMMDIRQRVLQQLDEWDFSERNDRAERYRLVLEHEYRRGEAILEILQLHSELYTPSERRRLPRGRRLADPGVMARFPGGAVEVGGTELSVWPEEKPAHTVEVPAFWIDVLPVTNGDYITFMTEGGYAERSIWSEEGWAWLKDSQAKMPPHWSWQDGSWWTRSMGRESPLDLTCPVSQVSYYEAEAFARFVGKRLPTEVEWEAAAGWEPESQVRRHYPWGNMRPSPHVANLDQLAFEPAPVGAFPGNVSPIGCYGMVGDVWEWTSSSFLPYPGGATAAAPAPEFNPEYKVLRGGSWATRPGAIRVSVRRPCDPGVRHAFTGFRCARDA